MIPNIDILMEEITEVTYPNKSYRIAFSSKNQSDNSRGLLSVRLTNESDSYDRISGYVDDLEAVVQAVYLILSTERYKFNIYSWDYGVELVDLIGKPIPYVISELPRRIKEALTMDNRIDDVVDFEFEKNGKILHVKFTVVSNVGNITTDMEVEV